MQAAFSFGLPAEALRRLVEAEGEISNQLFQILEEWNTILQNSSVDFHS